MAFVFVQYWAPLPPILENQPSVDVFGNNRSQFSPNYSTFTPPFNSTYGRFNGLIMPELPNPNREQYGSSPGGRAGSASNQQQQQNFYQQQLGQSSAPQGQSSMNQAPGIGRPSPLNMSSLQQALPDYGQGYPQQSPQRYQQTGQPTNTQLAYQLQQLSQYGAPGVSNQQPPTPAYNQQFLQQFSGNYGPGQGAQSGQPGITPIQQFYANQPFPQQQGRQGQQPQVSQFYYQQAQFSGGPQMFPQGALQAGQFVNRMPGERQPMRQGSNEQLSAGGVIGRACSTGSNIARPSSSTIRGPPRKPKQSGHALWVGNLPPGANVIDLKDHFSEGATDDILSVFLISKSNCAFVNYKTEEACAKAVTRFHDSRFQGVRLVCRLRRSSVAAVSGVPTGPAALAGQSKEVGSVTSASKEPTTDTPSDVEKAEAREGENQDDRAYAKDKYFVVKSLTVEDLETSVRTGIWATQAHNEEALNKAFRTAENVYLIFSANKSGEYFGYARMTSPISSDPSKAIQFAPTAQAVEDIDQPKAIPTPATATAPRGRIIDDSARGTIFWEAEDNEASTNATLPNDTSDDSKAKNKDKAEAPTTRETDANSGESENEDENKTWGKPFNLEWISTAKVPFWKTRGLRNAWNAGREVKIARDGTELETLVGRRLIGMFVREEMGGGGGGPGGPGGGMPGMMQMSPGMGFPGAGRGW